MILAPLPEYVELFIAQEAQRLSVLLDGEDYENDGFHDAIVEALRRVAKRASYRAVTS